MVTLKEVCSEKDLDAFVKFPLQLYRDSAYFVPPLLKKEKRTLVSGLNGYSSKTKANYWLAEKNGKTVGRVAGIIRTENEKKEARFGWLDFINDPEVAGKLLETVEDWCRDQGATCLHGPLGFISFDRSGVLVSGFDRLPTSFSTYNYPYYQELIRQAGYQEEFKWVEYRINVPDQVPQRITRGSAIVQNRFKLKLHDVKDKKELAAYSEELRLLLNQSYKGLKGFSPLTPSEFNDLYQQFITYISLDFFALVRDSNQDIVGFGLAMPDMARAFIKMKGRLSPFGYWHLYRSLRQADTVDLLLIAVKPTYRNKGVPSIIFEKICQSLLARKVKFVESTKELEDNQSIQNLWSEFDHEQHKVSTCYLKALGQ